MINKIRLFEELEKIDSLSIESRTQTYLKIQKTISDFVRFKSNKESIRNFLQFEMNYSDDVKKIIISEIINKVDKGSPIYNELCKYYKTLISKKNLINSYQWQGKDEDLLEFYNQTISEYKLIASETSLDQFRAVFSSVPIKDISPIKWRKDNASELIYFISKLVESNNINGNKRLDYQKMKSCFIKPDGTKFTEAFKSLKQNIEINLAEDKRTQIDELIKAF